jgi:excisionase family DNA binding protein
VVEGDLRRVGPACPYFLVGRHVSAIRGCTMDDTQRPLKTLSTGEIEDLLVMHLGVAEQCGHELAVRARQRFIPTPGRFKRQSEGELSLLVEVAEAAALLRVDPRTVQRYCNAGRLSYVVVGKRRLIERSALDEFIEQGKMAGLYRVRDEPSSGK